MTETGDFHGARSPGTARIVVSVSQLIRTERENLRRLAADAEP